MNGQTIVLINGKDPSIIKMSSMALGSEDYHVFVSNENYKNLTASIERLNPDIVLIWNVCSANDILDFFKNLSFSDVRPFFILTTCYKNIFGILDECLPRNACAVFEPISMDFIKKIMKKASEENLNFEA